MDKKRILLAEDEKDMVYAVTLQLEASGYEVLSASDGQEALAKARKEKPDLMILDLMLPKMDGYKVCGLLKADTRYNKIPIIMFTARAQEADIQMGKEVGANAYLTKPFEPKVLLGKIQELLSHKK
jgi:DNA-binding response OmpR family regulator